MKKLINILLAVALCVGTWGCSDDDDPVAVQLLKVVSSDVTFEYEGGNGSIQFASELPVEVSSSTPWCHVALQGKEVVVKVDVNDRPESRSAKVILKAGDEQTWVPVYQHGEKITIDKPASTNISSAGETISLKCSSIHEVKVSLSQDWMSYSLQDGILTLTAQPMPYTGERDVICTIEAGVHKITYKFHQEFWEVMQGEYNCFSAGKPYGTCTITKVEEGVYQIMPKGSHVDMPYYATLRGRELVINFGQKIAKMNYQGAVHDIILCAFDKKGFLNWGNKIEYVAQLGVSNEANKSVLEFKDTGSWKGQVVGGFFYGLFKADGSFAGTGWQAEDIVFVKK